MASTPAKCPSKDALPYVDPKTLYGGNVWQSRMFHRRVITLLGNGKMGLLSYPLEQGLMICVAKGKKWQYTLQELAEKFISQNWEHLGQFNKLAVRADL